MKKRNLKKGFTIVELVIVIAVIAILSAVLIPTFGSVVANAEEAALKADAKAIYTEYVAQASELGETVLEEIYVKLEDGATDADDVYIKVSNGVAIDAAKDGLENDCVKFSTLAENSVYYAGYVENATTAAQKKPAA